MEIRKKENIDYNKDKIEWTIITLSFIFSFVNNATLMMFLGLLLVLFYQKEAGAIKIMVLLTLRSIINPGLAVELDSFQLIKLGLIFLSSLYIILNYNKIPVKDKSRSSILITAIIIFGVYNILSSWFFSMLPVVAVFKIVSYIVPFIAILIGTLITQKQIDWLNWLDNLFKIILIPSLFLVNSPIGYLVNGFSFQGITNQPNILGPTMVLYLSILFAKLQRNKGNKLLTYILIILVFYLIILSNSRTALISSSILCLLLLMFLNIQLKRKILYFIVASFVSIMLFAFWFDDLILPLINFIEEFLYKGQSTILYSRTTQIGTVLDNFYRNPFFGSGFGVPYTHQRSYSFSTNVPVEPGNLIFSVLSYGGVFGFYLFSIFLLLILFQNKKYFRITSFLFFSPILVSMGEMIFFSTNNIGIWCYLLLGIYYSYNES